MAKITIKYTAPVAPNVQTGANICRCFYPADCAADMPAMEGTAYDTNVAGWGEGTTLEQFIQQSIAHPGLIAALKVAVREGQCVLNDADDNTVVYLKEVAPAIADQGFTVEFAA